MNAEQANRNGKISPASYIIGLGGQLTELKDCFDGNGGEVYDIRFRIKSDGVMILVKRFSPDDGTPQIKFGNAYDLVSALLGLHKMVASVDGWRADKPYIQGQGAV